MLDGLAAGGLLFRNAYSDPVCSPTRTTVIVLGDNGTPSQVTTPPTDPSKAKGKVYEGGVRVPLVISGRGVMSPGREVTALVNTVDLLQTVMDLMGAGNGDRPPSVSLWS